MAGVKITQLRPQMVTGRRYGSFAGKPEGSGLLAWSRGGVVPIRYVIGTTANVVPVETVATWEIGVVPVQELVGPAHVVPVREAAGETPRVKIVRVLPV